jgi:hypothetical protein
MKNKPNNDSMDFLPEIFIPEVGRVNEDYSKTIGSVKTEWKYFDDFKKKIKVYVDTKITDNKQKKFKKKFIKKITMLDNTGYKLLEPFPVNFSFKNHELIGQIKELELYAFGKSEEEIINELKLDIIDLYEYYSEFNDNDLGKDPLKWKQILLKKIVHGR